MGSPPFPVALVERRGPEECWPWTGSVNPGGYGTYCSKMAHREALRRVEPPRRESLVCCHRCDNPRCCNPRHLFWGTRRENTLDRDRKGRAHIKESRSGAIIRHLKAGLTVKAAAIALGATTEEVRQMKRMMLEAGIIGP